MTEENNKITVRMAEISDAEELLAIYAPYVTKTAITFEYEIPSLREFEDRIQKIRERYPYLAAVENGKIIGYSYARAFGERAAYARSAETVLYIEENCRGKGVGTLLYHTLEEILKKQNITNLYACIAATNDPADRYLTNASPSFHEALGYHKVGHFSNCGYKFGCWYDMVRMEKFIGVHEEKPKPFRKISEIGEILFEGKGLTLRENK